MKTILNVCALMLFLCCVSVAEAVDIQKVLHETQKMTQKDGGIHLVWWIPTEFWEESFRQEKGMTQAQKDEFIKVLDVYTVFAVINMKSGPFGGMTPKNTDEIVKNFKLQVNKETIPALADSELSPDAKNFFTMMKPMMANMLGQFGQGMEFLVFSNKKDGKKLLNPKEAGTMKCTSFKEEFNWRLPLGSLLPPKVDPKTGEEFPGNYMYNPFTGDELEAKTE